MIRRFKRRQENRKFYRTNERIFALTLRVLDSSGKQIGVLPKFEALKKAKEEGLDLVEIAPMAKPPVAKIIDFKKFLYQEKKKKKEEKKKSKVSETKEIRLGPFMNDHDLRVMVRRAEVFLNNNDKVKLVVKFAGRQIAHPEFGQKIAQRVVASLSNISKIEREAHFEGRQLIALLSPERSSKGRSGSNDHHPLDEASGRNGSYEEKNKEISK